MQTHRFAARTWMEYGAGREVTYVPPGARLQRLASRATHRNLIKKEP
jgi:hypothetical protein